MKKLMIALGAAAMMSLGAQAKPADGVSLATGTDFDSYQDTWAPDKDDNGLRSGTVYWTGGGGDSSIEVNPNDATDKYLKVDETEALTRKIKVVNDALEPQSVASSSIYFSSKVQFTAADDAPEATEGVDKIIVWAKAPADDADPGTTTNLMVTAWDENGTVTNVDTQIAIDAESWYDLEIVASPSAQGSVSPISFMVKLGDRAAVGPFLSMVDAETEGATTISSASFKGTGAVDDIDWGTVTAAAPVPVTISYTVNGVADDPDEPIVTINDAEGDPISAENVPNVGDTLTIIVAKDQTYSVTCAGLTFTYIPYDDVSGEGYNAWVATYTLTAQDGEGQNPSKVFAITVTAGGQGGDEPEIVVPEQGTAQGVVDAATSATGIPLKNVTAENADQVVINNENHTITIGEAVVTFPAYYTAAMAGDYTKVTLTLNDAALDTAGDMTAVTVGDNFGLSVGASNTKLYYGLSSSTTVGGVGGKYAAPTSLMKGTGNALAIPAAKSGDQRFYKLYVTDVVEAGQAVLNVD